jgi:hypothetical protein
MNLSVTGQPEPLLSALTPLLIQRHAYELTNLDAIAIRDTLVPHSGLPLHDPAGYLMAYRKVITPSSVENPAGIFDGNPLASLSSSYDLGVVFGSSLLRRAHMESGALLPAVQSEELDIDGRRLIERYLHDAYETPVGQMVGNNTGHPELTQAVELFSAHCNEVVPELMAGGSDELKRGCHDLLSIVALLEAENTEEQNRLMRIFLGRTTLAA